MENRPDPLRRTYIDWLRGVAVAIMIEWHTVDAWTATDARHGAIYHTLVLLGGWAAPLFLFLAGVSVSLSAQAQADRAPANVPDAVRTASWAVQKRGWQIFLIAHLFRFQSFLFDLSASWSSLLRPDILNILGLGMVAAAFCWGRARTFSRRVVWLLAPAALVVLLSPASGSWWWPTLLPPRLEAYIRPVGSLGVFTLFPWIAFVLVGACVGAFIARPRPAEAEARFHHRLGLAGAAVAVAGYFGSFVPSPFANSDFWTTSASFFVIRVGVMLIALALAWQWLTRASASRWSPMVVFGRTSLFVYWVHIGIVYGAVSRPWQHALTLPWTLAAYLALTAFMLGCAVLWSRGSRRPWVPRHMIAETWN